MEAAFVDIGLERNGFLHVDEIVLPDGQAAPKRGRGKGRRIDELIKPRQEILVQVVKDPLKTKGARLSMQLSVAGRYLVYMPQGERRRRQPPAPRQGARPAAQAARQAPTTATGGLIVRTAAQGAKKEDFEREIDYLHKLQRGARAARQGRRGAGAGLPGGRPLGARPARRAAQRVRGGDHRRPEAAPAGDELLPAHRAGAGRARSSYYEAEAAVRALRRRGGVRLDALSAASTCPRAAT